MAQMAEQDLPKIVFSTLLDFFISNECLFPLALMQRMFANQQGLLVDDLMVLAYAYFSHP